MLALKVYCHKNGFKMLAFERLTAVIDVFWSQKVKLS